MLVYNRLVNKEAKIAIIGLGYVGLPLALSFAKKLSVIGFDIDQRRIDALQKSIDPDGEMTPGDFDACDISFSTDPTVLRQASFYIVTVPTPVDEHKIPFIGHVQKASEIIAGALSVGNYVVYESTVYPGCTEEDCLPVLEQGSGLQFVKDFKIGYSPERINVGDKTHTISSVVKVVSGCDAVSLDEIAKVYELIIDAGVHRASSIKVAEAAKIIENTQRDLNIALMNELSIIFNKMDINTQEVLDAAATKWNFVPYQPGLVGGHCIGVDPYYLTYKAAELGYNAKVILAGRVINDGMGKYVAAHVLQHIIRHTENVKQSRVLVLGTTFKENVSDIRNSKTSDVIVELQSFSITVDVVDPYADSNALFSEYGFRLAGGMDHEYDAIILAVLHDDYKYYNEVFFKSHLKAGGLFADIKGFYRNTIKEVCYWSL